MPVTIKHSQQDYLTAYHGAKFGDVDTVLNGIKRPSGSAGNFDDDWKGFYVADQQRGAIGYATVSNEFAETAIAKGDYSVYHKAGALLQVDFPGPITVLEVNSEADAIGIKKALGLNENKPLIDQLGDPVIIKEKWPNSKLVVLKREVETLPGTFEIIIPWNLAESGKPIVVERFDKLKFGEDARQTLDSKLSCGLKSSYLKSYAGDRICGLNWGNIRENSIDKAKSLTSDKEFLDLLPERSTSRPASKHEIEHTFESSRKHSALNGAGEAIDKASLLLWASNMAQVLTDNSSTSLDKVTAIVGIVPGIGDVFSLADSVEHDDVEGVVTSSIALAGFVASQAVPVVGELVDLALLTKTVVSSITTLISNYIQSTQRPAVTLPSAIAPVTVNGVTVRWRTKEDQTITLPPNYGRKVQILDISAEKGKSVPLIAIVGHQNDGYFNIEPDRIVIFQDSVITTVNISLVSQNTTYVAFPTSPITVAYGRPVSIRLSYTTHNTGDKTITSPVINLALGNDGQTAPPAPLDVPQGVNELLENNIWLSTRFYVNPTQTCFSKVSYFNQGGYVANLEIATGDGILSTSSLALGQMEDIDLTGHNIPDGAILSSRISIKLGGYKTGPMIKYCAGSGKIANLKSWGTVFSPQLDFDAHEEELPSIDYEFKEGQSLSNYGLENSSSFPFESATFVGNVLRLKTNKYFGGELIINTTEKESGVNAKIMIKNAKGNAYAGSSIITSNQYINTETYLGGCLIIRVSYNQVFEFSGFRVIF